MAICACDIVVFINFPNAATLNPVELSYQEGGCNVLFKYDEFKKY